MQKHCKLIYDVKLCYHRGQAEKEFRVEVEAIGHVRHKNLVRLLGYCVEGTQRSVFLISLDSICIAMVLLTIKFLFVIIDHLFESFFLFLYIFFQPKFRMLVYEYVNNGNLEQWLHGAMRHHGALTWEARIKTLLGTARA